MSSEDLNKRKDAARKMFLKAREGMSETETAVKNQSILEKVLDLEAYRSARTVHLYASIGERNEVDTFQLMKHSLGAGKRIIVPVMQDDGRLIHASVHSIKDLQKNSWGVPEPVDPDPVEEPDPDLIIVPMVAGDLKKNRLGYGKGYYDRFLKGRDTLKAGLLYELQIAGEPLPTGPHDVPLDMLITEKRVIR